MPLALSESSLRAIVHGHLSRLPASGQNLVGGDVDSIVKSTFAPHSCELTMAI